MEIRFYPHYDSSSPLALPWVPYYDQDRADGTYYVQNCDGDVIREGSQEEMYKLARFANKAFVTYASLNLSDLDLQDLHSDPAEFGQRLKDFVESCPPDMYPQ